MKSSGIGGQAVIEGVMMKNGDHYAVAVRTPDGKIEVDKQCYESFGDRHSWAKLPLIRGVVTFAESMSIGMKTLTYSASFFEEEEQEESKLEKAFSNLFKDKAEKVLIGITVVLAIIIAIGLFMFLPWIVAEQLGKMIHSPILQAVVEGVLRLAIFVIYVAAISLTSDIKRVYMYHGAEHKTINCVEQGLELNVENVRKQSKEHRRCGTSFLLYVMIISIVLFMFIRVDSAALRIILRVALVPVVAGISYEYIRFMGNHQGPVIDILSRPGFWMQALTTREPKDEMIEVAIASVDAVFDWKAYLEGLGVDINTEEKKTSRVAVLKKADRNIRRGDFFHESIADTDTDELSGLDITFSDIANEAKESVLENAAEKQSEIQSSKDKKSSKRGKAKKQKAVRNMVAENANKPKEATSEEVASETSVSAEVKSLADESVTSADDTKNIAQDNVAEKSEEKANVQNSINDKVEEQASTVPEDNADKTADTKEKVSVVSDTVKEELDFVQEDVPQEKEEPEVSSEKNTETKVAKKRERKASDMPHVAALKKAAGVRRPLQPIEELRRDSFLIDSAAEDDDEILNALDKFFDE